MAGPYRSILVVDDDADIRMVLTELLTDEDFSVHAAQNGREALEWLDHSGALPAAIILDLSMPIMDGRAFLSVRRSDPELAKVPVLVVSAETDSFDPSGRQEISAFIHKPFVVENLLTTIERTLV